MSAPQTDQSKQPPSKRRKWLRRCLWVLALLVVARVALAFGAVPAVRLVAGMFDLECEVDSIEFDVFSGEARLYGLTLWHADSDASSPIVELEYAGVDIATSELLRGNLIVRRVEADGLDLYIARDDSGRWNIAPVIDSLSTENAATTPEEADDEQTQPTGPLEFDLPFIVEALRGSHLRLHLDDALADPPLDATITALVRISDLGQRGRKTKVSIAAAGPQVLDSFELDADIAARGPDIDASLDVRLRGLHPRPLAGYFELIGLEPVAERLDADLLVAVDAAATQAGGNRFELVVSDAQWRTDDAEALALDNWTTAVAFEPGPLLHIEPLVLSGARAALEIDELGRPSAAGFAFIGTPAGSDSAPTIEAEMDDDAGTEASVATGPPTKLVDQLPFALRLDGIEVAACAVRFTDHSQSPSQAFEVELETLQLADLDTSAPEQPTTWSARLQAPGLLGTLDCVGELSPFAAAPMVHATFDSRGADLAKLEPYLAAAGLESSWVDGRASAAFDASATPLDTGNWSIDCSFSEVQLAEADSETPWFAIANAGLNGLVVDMGAQSIALGEARIVGLRSSAQRLADGSWQALGVRTRVAAAGDVIIHTDSAPANASDAAAVAADSPVATTEVAPEPASDATAIPWHLAIGKLVIEDTDLSFHDDAITPAVDFRFDELGASIEDLSIGGDDGSAGRARVRAFLREPGLADSIELTGNLTGLPDRLGLAWTLELTGDGLAPIALKPYLDRMNVEIVDETSVLRVRFDGTAALVDNALELDAAATDLAIGPADEPFLAADAVRIGGVRVASDAVAIGELTFTEPALRLGRRADGALLIAGLSVGGSQPADAPDAADAADDSAQPNAPVQPESAATVEVHVTDDAPQDPFAALDTLALEFQLDHFAIDGAHLYWRDEAVEPAMDTVIVMRASVDGLALRPGAADAGFEVEAHVDGEERLVRIAGRVVLDPRAIALDGELVGEHLDFERLSVYFPPSIQSEATDARIESSLHVELNALDVGGRALLVECTDVRITQAGIEAPALTLGSARMHAPRLDGATGVYEVAELTTSDFELRVHRDLQSRWHALGLVIDPAAQAPNAGEPTDPATSSEPEVRTVSMQPTASDADLPSIKLGSVDVGIDRLIVTDEMQGEGAEPLVIEMRATTQGPQVLMSEDPASLLPFELRLSAKLTPLIDTVALDIEIAPFAPQPSASGTLAMTGLDGEGLLALLPQLADAIDASGLPAGEFGGRFELVLDARRRGLTSFDFERGFGLDLLVSDLAYRAQPDGEVLVGLESIEVTAPRINPARQEVIIQRIEIVEPRARFARDAQCIHALGLVIDPVALEAAFDQGVASDTNVNDLTAKPVQAAAPVDAAPSTPSSPAGELRIDELLVSGIDFDFDDESYDPPLHVPLTGLSVEISRFTTHALTEKLPVRFNAYLEAGDVPLGEGHEPAPFFQEATLRGQISVFPALEGWLDAGVSELALRALRGPAGASGVTINDGTLDGNVRVRLRGERGMTINTKSNFRDLSMSEPSDGPIGRYLGISMPLESAIFALRNSSGEVVLAPPAIQIGSAGISTTEIARVAATAIAKEITLAVARAPLRLTKGVADTAGAITGNIPLVGGVTGGIFSGVSGLFGGGPEEPLPEIGSIEYLPGDVNLLEREQPKLQEAIRQLRGSSKRAIVLIHEFTSADLARAEELANPSAEDCWELSQGLRQKKAELYRLRDEVAADARARLLTGQESEAALAVERLRTIDSELGRTELALDQTLELLQPGAERRRDKRGRNAAMAIAEARLEAVVAALREAGISKLDQRLEVRRPRPRPVETEDQSTQGGRIKLGVQ